MILNSIRETNSSMFLLSLWLQNRCEVDVTSIVVAGCENYGSIWVQILACMLIHSWLYNWQAKDVWSQICRAFSVPVAVSMFRLLWSLILCCHGSIKSLQSWDSQEIKTGIFLRWAPCQVLGWFLRGFWQSRVSIISVSFEYMLWKGQNLYRLFTLICCWLHVYTVLVSLGSRCCLVPPSGIHSRCASTRSTFQEVSLRVFCSTQRFLVLMVLCDVG